MSIQNVRDGRNLPFLKRGMRVQVDGGKFGTITGANRSMNLNVRLDGEKHSGNYHPTWKMRYFDENGNVIAEFTN
ncbi:TPA: hypothetical protein L3310_003248 [Vibrio cholerae]|nr:hypothetical protein [Vibrio cholerae]HBN6886276.1 hypothetical protein [Vibrio cholerae]HBN6896873.1 hypothetical protein [Vibrio cholerae]HDI3250120.1 hypothetical protein [Vibrio cholerae]